MIEAGALWPEVVSAYRAGSYEKAQELARQLVAMEPRHVQALHLLSVIAYRKKDSALEMIYLKKVLAVDPYHTGALNGMANLLRAKGDLERAAKVCSQILTMNPLYANAYNTLGLCQFGLGRHEEAANSFNSALMIQPEFGAAKVNLEAAFARLGIKTSAEREALLAPKTGRDYERRAGVLFSQRKRKESIECFEKAAELEPNSLRILVELAESKRNHAFLEVL